MATLRLPRVLAGSAKAGLQHAVMGEDLNAALASLFEHEPGLRNHLLDESGAIRPHVLVFVNGERAHLDTTVPEDAEIQVLQAVSGG